jgi:hypothetical protein
LQIALSKAAASRGARTYRRWLATRVVALERSFVVVIWCQGMRLCFGSSWIWQREAWSISQRKKCCSSEWIFLFSIGVDATILIDTGNTRDA